MIDEQRAAAVLYGAPATPITPAKPATPASTPASAPAQPTADAGADAASKLYGEPEQPDAGEQAKHEAEQTHANLREIEQADANERAAIESTHGASMRAIRSELTDRAGYEPDEARSNAETAGRLFHAHGISSTDAEYATEVAVASTINPPDEQKLIEWRSKAHDVLRSEYGSTADLAMSDARALVAKDQKLHDWLDRTGLGNHPVIVRIVANRARALRNAGRLA